VNVPPITLLDGRHPVAALGSSYHDLCADPSCCPACSLWPLAGETREAWFSRLGALYRATRAHVDTYGSKRRAS
jgi:hypothetical protein